MHITFRFHCWEGMRYQDKLWKWKLVENLRFYIEWYYEIMGVNVVIFCHLQINNSFNEQNETFFTNMFLQKIIYDSILPYLAYNIWGREWV